MTRDELAALLDGREYASEISKAEEAEAKANMLAVFFGASDDLLEARGAIYDEWSTCDGVTVRLTADLKTVETRDDEDELIEAGWTPPNTKFSITAEWLPDDKCSGRITTTLPSSPFKITEESEVYCEGVVIDLKEIGDEA